VADDSEFEALRALLYHLGGEVFAMPIAVGRAPGAQAIGTLCGLPVWSTHDGGRQTLKLARLLARHARLGIVLASGRDRWFAAVTLQPVRLTAMAADDRDALPLRRLARAARPAYPTPIEAAVALADALDVDAAGRRTFRLLHQLLDHGVALLPARVPHEDRHAWTLTQLTRLLFLRFVESEGWLDGNPRFLAEHFDRCLHARRDPTRALLHPLFFGTLNQPIANRSRMALGFGAIPFLNGGLFQPHPVERAWPMRLPTAYWRDAFAALVDRVDVTLDHDTIDGRVTPELLGRVFEGAMEPAERRQRGTFFTPPALVDALMRDALTAHLADRTGTRASVVARALDDPDRAMLRTLLDVTVLDPAAGSGAFLVGALALLHGPGRRDPHRVGRLMAHNLYGVDLHPGAVRICELRLWLEVLRAMRGRTPSRLPPLPNLDATIRAGDALIDPLHGMAVAAPTARLLRQRHRGIAAVHGSDKRVALAALQRGERAAVIEALCAREAAVTGQIDEMIAAARAPSLFGESSRLSTRARRHLAAARAARRSVRSERRRVAREASAAPFALRIAFAPVLARRGGFDLVVGNPPWVRAERLPAEMRAALAERYRWWRSGPSAHWRHQPDLAVAFVERSWTLLAPGGTLGLLVPAKLTTAAYAAPCRAAMTTHATLHCVADLSDDPRAGFEATTYPLAIVASRRPATADHLVQFGLERTGAAQLQSHWSDGASWNVSSPAAQMVAARLARLHPSLSLQVRAQLGIKTGMNAAFLNPPVALRPWCRPAIRGRDIRPFRATPGVVILWPADARGQPWASLPRAIAEHFAAWEPQLRQRADQHRGPWWQLFRTRAATAPHRVVWRDLAPELQAARLGDGEALPLNTCYVAAMPSGGAARALTAWLNASPIRALARLGAEPAAGGCARFGARTVGQVPLPSAALHDLRLQAQAGEPGGAQAQQALDDVVSELLELSTDEREALNAVATYRR
jgi:hypothetical protein